MKEELIEKFADIEEDAVMQIVQKAIDAQTDPQEILSACQDAMSEVGKRFEEGTYFLSELIFSGHIFTQINELIKPLIGEGDQGKKLGKVVIGTVAGDVHNIGKDIVACLLEANNFEVHDIGVDQPKEAFVAKLKETGATILGLSGLLTVAFGSMKDTVDTLKAEGLRDKVKVMIGGGTVSQEVCEYVGADGWGSSAQKAVSFCQKNI